MKNYDLVVRCDHLVSMSGGRYEPLRDQMIGIVGSKIEFVGPWTPDGWKATRTLHRPNSVVLPGLVNGHCHMAMTMFRGLADDLPFDKWLHGYILPVEGKLVSADFVRTGARLAALESLLGGVTTIVDMYYFQETTAEVLDASGMRGLVGEGVADFPAPDNKSLDGSEYRLLDRLAERYGRHERVVPVIAPHAPYTCSDATLKKAAEWARAKNLPLTIHVSETKGEVEGQLKEHGKTPPRRLFDLGVMDTKQTIFAHCVHLTDDDMALLAKTGTSAIHNPESNMKLGAGAARIRKMLDLGLKVGLGTDGTASNNDLNMFKEMDVAAKLQKLSNADNTAMTAAQALRMATYDGARALGLGDLTGSLEAGKRADFIVVSLDEPHMRPLHDLAAQLVYAATGQEVRDVFVDGRQLVDDRRCLTIERDALYADVERIQGLMKTVIG